MSIRNAYTTAAMLASLGALAACSGGGGGGGTPSALPAASTPAPTATPAPPQSSSVSGNVVDLAYDGSAAHPGTSVQPNGTAAAPGAAISGARVFIGPSIVTGAVAPSSIPAGFESAITDTSGGFTISNVPFGHQALTIFAPAPHVTIVHQDVIVSAPSTAAGTYFMTVPSLSEAAWFAQENVDRSIFAMPATLLDESVLESARYWAEFMQAHTYFAHCIPASLCVSGDTTPAPASYGPQDVDPQHRYAFFHGYSSGREGENIAAGFGDWQSVDSTFMAEAAACPNGSPTNCPFNESTGHFLNIIDPNYVWTGMGVAALAGNGPYYDQEFSLLDSTTPNAVPAALRRGLRLAR